MSKRRGVGKYLSCCLAVQFLLGRITAIQHPLNEKGDTVTLVWVGRVGGKNEGEELYL